VRALILANGELHQPDVLRRRIHAEAFDLVLAADGGARYGANLNIVPDTVIGDFDSFSDSERQNLAHAEFISYPAEKDETDLELALLYAAKQGAGQIVLVGALGGRMDMSLANILLLAHAGLAACRIEVWHGAQTGWLIRPPGEAVAGRPGDTLSLMPLAGTATGVTISGFKYPLRDDTLTPGLTWGLSNVMEKPSAHVALLEGLLLAVHTARDGDGER
jgi:thiamine pyrophosphokinase